MMLDLEQLSKIRFGMSEVPKPGGQRGDYEEKWSQWFLERSFFRDFVYRNPRGKRKGEELADAVTLFDDVAVMVQVKAQHGRRDPLLWAEEKLKEAFRQVKNTHDDLFQGRIQRLTNDYYGEIAFHALGYPNRFGIIILAHDSPPYVAPELVTEILTASFPVHVFSLRDFAMIASRFDTAGDLITFLEMRGDVAARERLFVQEEATNIERMIPHVKEILRSHMSPTTEEILDRTARSMQQTARGELLRSPDWRYGIVIDDMTARAHDRDPELQWNKRSQGPKASLEVARYFGWSTREKRIRLGRRIIAKCEEASDGELHYFRHIQPSREACCVYLVTSQSRPERIKTLRYLVGYAYTRPGMRKCVGVATEPIGNGRSYDFYAPQKPPPSTVLDKLKEMGDLFSSDESL